MITYFFSKGQNVNKVNQSHFPDGTLYIEPLDIQPLGGPCEITWCYDSDSEMFTLACVVDILRRNGIKEINLTLPYLPHARMDRIHRLSENFSLKVFANFINSLKFECVTVINVHSPVSEALIENIYSLLPRTGWSTVIDDYEPDVIVFPDEGSCKRYSEVDIFKNYPIVFGIKKRDWSTGKILGLELHGADVKNKRCLIVDDICSAGGTFYHTANELLTQGASEVRLYVTHCENNVKNGELLKDSSPISKIYTTDSILTDKEVLEKVEIVSSYRT